MFTGAVFSRHSIQHIKGITLHALHDFTSLLTSNLTWLVNMNVYRWRPGVRQRGHGRGTLITWVPPLQEL